MAVIIGLCGNVCSGKSTVAGMFAGFGAEVIDADEVSRFVVVPGKPAFERIVQKFGKNVLDSDGKIDRTKLAKAVFSDSAKRKVLESITHPEIRDEIKARVEKAVASGAKAVVIEAALLSRSGVLGEIVDALILVKAGEEEKIERMAERDGFDSAQARERLKSQAGRNPDSDFVIDNSGDLEMLRTRVEKLWREVVP